MKKLIKWTAYDQVCSCLRSRVASLRKCMLARTLVLHTSTLGCSCCLQAHFLHIANSSFNYFFACNAVHHHAFINYVTTLGFLFNILKKKCGLQNIYTGFPNLYTEPISINPWDTKHCVQYSSINTSSWNFRLQHIKIHQSTSLHSYFIWHADTINVQINFQIIFFGVN